MYRRHRVTTSYSIVPVSYTHLDVYKRQALYKRAEMVILNREEAMMITGKGHESVAELAAALHGLGPRNVVITDGPDGSYASFDGRLLKMPNYPDPAPPYDRTGAGDAFASTIVAALALGNSFETALLWAPINLSLIHI